MSMRTIVNCDLCREDITGDEHIASLTVAEVIHPDPRDRVACEIDMAMRRVFGPPTAATRTLHVCQGCVHGLLTASLQHGRMVGR